MVTAETGIFFPPPTQAYTSVIHNKPRMWKNIIKSREEKCKKYTIDYLLDNCLRDHKKYVIKHKANQELLNKIYKRKVIATYELIKLNKYFKLPEDIIRYISTNFL